jgi:hypothetical protein
MIGTAGTASRTEAMAEADRDREIDEISEKLQEQGAMDRSRLAELLSARRWGPGRFRPALRAAVSEGRARRDSGDVYSHAGAPNQAEPPGGSDDGHEAPR